jgi:hypothetical protein
MVVGTLGLLLAVTVTASSVQDNGGAAKVMARACHKDSPSIPTETTGPSAQAIEHFYKIRDEVVYLRGSRLTGFLHDSRQPLWPQPCGWLQRATQTLG